MTHRTGGCHCGKVRYEADADLSQVISCNCSICSKRGSLLSFVTADKFKLLSGENDLKDYQFNKMIIHHLFCTNCGIMSFARADAPNGNPMVALNVRCLDGVDVDALKITPVDGKKF